jgi:thiosulfate reductase cytochrome b subunit
MDQASAVELLAPAHRDPAGRRMHPLPVRIMHWINAVTIFIMIGSGWKIYEDDPIFGWLQFADFLTIGRWAQHGLQWHFFGMWILAINGLCYLTYGIVTHRFRRMLFPLSGRDLVHTVNDALHFRLAHEDLSQYNTVQKLLYLGVIMVGILIVVSGLAIWKPIQFDGLVALLGGFQNARLIHFLCMSAIFGFVVIHVTLALLVPQTIVAMLNGGPLVKPAQAVAPRAASSEDELPDPSASP